MAPARQDYCQFLLSTQINYTQTYFADHHRHFSHDAINRYLLNDNVTPSDIWASTKDQINYDPDGCLIFDDSVLDKRHSFQIEMVQRQYSGNEHGIIKGIGVVNCLYVNLKTGQYWIIDWRIFNPEADGKTKLDHLRDMLDDAIALKHLPFRTVLMDSWYATKDVMLHIDRKNKIFYCPLKSNRKVDDANGKGKAAYKAVSTLQWSESENIHGKIVKIHEFPGDKKVKLFRVAAANRTDWIATNDLSQNSTDDTHDMCTVRWKIEQYHREVKQTLGIEKCQCRITVAQKNHIGCVILVWNHLTKLARKLGTSIYALKKGIISDYMKNELVNPSIRMASV